MVHLPMKIAPNVKVEPLALYLDLIALACVLKVNLELTIQELVQTCHVLIAPVGHTTICQVQLNAFHAKKEHTTLVLEYWHVTIVEKGALVQQQD